MKFLSPMKQMPVESFFLALTRPASSAIGKPVLQAASPHLRVLQEHKGDQTRDPGFFSPARPIEKVECLEVEMYLKMGEMEFQIHLPEPINKVDVGHFYHLILVFKFYPHKCHQLLIIDSAPHRREARCLSIRLPPVPVRLV